MSPRRPSLNGALDVHRGRGRRARRSARGSPGFNGALDVHRGRAALLAVRADVVGAASMGPSTFIEGERLRLLLDSAVTAELQWGPRRSSRERRTSSVRRRTVTLLQWGPRRSSRERSAAGLGDLAL